MHSVQGWRPAKDRPDPIQLLREQNTTRLEFLVPVRWQRMGVSPFTFFRGAARVFAHDMATVVTSGLTVQACGDAHLSNFGAYASAERQLVFDVNDFDETLPGPWEWDLCRLVASAVIAAQDKKLPTAEQSKLASKTAKAYRAAMQQFATMGFRDAWNASLRIDDLVAAAAKPERRRLTKIEEQAQRHTSLQALAKLTERTSEGFQIKSQPPLLIPFRDLVHKLNVPAVVDSISKLFTTYAESLQPDRRSLLQKYTPVDGAIKVVGVGSVGTRCYLALLRGRDDNDPLFLQVKEATTSVLADLLPASAYAHGGERVVQGQRMMQATSDVFLGWATDGEGRQYYWRQFRDWKYSADVAAMDAAVLERYLETCAWTLAHAHARSSDPAEIADAIETQQGFAKGYADFGLSYAKQNKADYEEFIASGLVPKETVPVA